MLNTADWISVSTDKVRSIVPQRPLVNGDRICLTVLYVVSGCWMYTITLKNISRSLEGQYPNNLTHDTGIMTYKTICPNGYDITLTMFLVQKYRIIDITIPNPCSSEK
jgi:hypothetical protein